MITGGTGGGVQGLTSSIAAGEDAKTTAWNTVKGIAGGATIGGSAAAIGYGAVKAGSKLLGTGVKACFIAGTVILTAGGLKKIEDIRAGDRVYARDVKSKEEGEKEVLQTFEREVDVLVHLWIDGEEIVTTQTHPFYVDGKGWTDAGKLTEQDNVLAHGERKLRVERIWIEELSEPVKVYNFEVEEYHTYYVGEAEVLVHNDCGQGNEGGETTRRQAFRQAKEAAGIPKTAQYETHKFVYDGSSENRIVYEFNINGDKKYIIEHPFDKMGRGNHFHGADATKGSPFDKGRYNQYDGHFPEDFEGFD